MKKSRNKKIKEIFENSANLLIESKILADDIDVIIKKILNSIKKDGKIVAVGNGGSAADAQHFVAELVGRYKSEREPLSAIALTTDTSIITAIGNDYGFEEVFSRQCKALVNVGDVILAISTSGNSENILQALRISRKKSAVTIGLSGKNGGKMNELCDVILKIPSTDTPIIQEIHGIVLHVICELIDESINASD